MTTIQTETINFVGFLEEALRYVDEWTPTEINNGGCGIFAAILSDKLTELGVKHSIWALFYHSASSSGFSNLKDFVSNGERNNNVHKAGEDHIVIQLQENLYFDSTGVVNVEVVHSRERVEITREQLQVLNDKGDWNPTFDRGTIPFIIGKMDEAFQHVNDFHSGMFVFPKKGQVKLTNHTMKYLQRVNLFSNLFNMITSTSK